MGALGAVFVNFVRPLYLNFLGFGKINVLSDCDFFLLVEKWGPGWVRRISRRWQPSQIATRQIDRP
jgi:hypothetical protein